MPSNTPGTPQGRSRRAALFTDSAARRRGSTVPVDAEGRPVGDCLLWSDTRGGRFSAKAVGGPVALFGYSPGNILRWVQLTGGAPSPNGADPLGHELYLRNCEPQIYTKARTLLEPLDYLALKLTGRA